MSVWHVQECRHTQARCILPNLPKCYRALLHHISVNLVFNSPSTPVQFDMWKNADVPRSGVPPTTPSWTLVLQSHTTQCEFDMWKNADIPRWHVSPPPSWTLVLQSPTTPSDYTYGRVQTYPVQMYHYPLLINLSGIKPYYAMSVWHVEACRHTHVRYIIPPNWLSWYRAIVHHVSLICGRMHTYPGQMYPTPWIAPSSTKPYYTMSVSHVQECRHM